MDTSTIVWIVVAAVVVLALLAVIAMAMKKKRDEHNRGRANELREQAAAQSTGVQQREAEARQTEAEARRTQAEADQKAAEAERLAAQASDKQSTAATYRQERDDNLRQADDLDPDAGKDKHDGDSDSSNDTTHQAGEHRADEHRVDDGTGSTIGEGQRYDADGHPIRADGSRTDVDSDTGTHRA